MNAPLERRPTGARVMPFLLPLLLVGLVASGGRAEAPSAQSPAQVFEAGLAAYQNGRYAEAAELFERAYALDPEASLLWNIGRAWERAGELERAIEPYLRFIASDDVDAEMKGIAGEAVIRIKRTLAERDAARAAAEAARPAPEPIEPAPPPPIGEPGPEPATPTLERTLERAPEGSIWPVVGWTGVGLGAAGAIAGTITLAVAESMRERVRSAKAGAVDGVVSTMTMQEARELQRDANTLGTGGIVGLAAGGALAVTGAVLLLTVVGDSPETATWHLGTEPRPGGVVVLGSASF